MSISQPEFGYLMTLEKNFTDSAEISLGPAPIRWQRELLAKKTKDAFTLHFYRGSVELKKFTYNKTVRTSIVLIRYDALGRHTNPPGTDGKSFDGPHVHLYRDGFDDKWAFPVTEIKLKENPTPTMEEVFEKFCAYCSILDCPPIQSSIC